MSLQLVTPEWWARSEALYRRSNELLGVDPQFTEKIVSEPTFRTHLWLWLVDGELVGLCRAVDSEWSCVTVEPTRRRQGHGRRMLEAWLQAHPEATPVRLSCLATNAEALTFYRTLPWLREGATIECFSRRHKIAYALVYFETR